MWGGRVPLGLGLPGEAQWVESGPGRVPALKGFCLQGCWWVLGVVCVWQLCLCKLHTRAGSTPTGGRGGTWARGDPSHRALFQVVNRLGLDSLSPFNPKERIIE